MIVKIKKLVPEAVIPSYAKTGDACMDLTATSWSDSVIHSEFDQHPDDGIVVYKEYKIGLAIEIPEGYFGLVRPRSSISTMDLQFATSGVIDSGYRGELMVRFKVVGVRKHFYKVGDRVAQLMILPYPQIEWEEVSELSETERGTGGHGSTGVRIMKDSFGWVNKKNI